MRKLMYFTLGFGGACAWGAYIGGQHWLTILIVALITGMVLLFLSRKHRFMGALALVCAGLVLGTGYFHIFDNVHLSAPRVLHGKTVSATIRTTDFSRETDYGFAVGGTINLDGASYDVLVYLNADDKALTLKPGQMVSGEFRFKVTTDGTIGNSTYHQGNGVFLIAYQRGSITVGAAESDPVKDYPAIWRSNILGLLDTYFPADIAGFAKALLLGDSSDLSYEVDTAFKISGIRHIIAVSGLHVSILFSVVYMLSGKRRLMTALLGIPLLLVFAAVTGFTPSVTRASVMQILMILALLLNREYDPPTALSFSALIMMWLNPLVITSVSFQLSIGCMIGIFLFAERIRQWILSDRCLGEGKGKSLKSRLKRWFAGSISVTLSAMAVTTPLCAWYFGTISIIGIVTNLLTLWIVTFIFCGVGLVCLFGGIWPAIAARFAWVCTWAIRYAFFVARGLASVPVAAVYTKSAYVVRWLILCYALIGLFLFAKKKRPVIFATTVVASLCAALLMSWAAPLKDECRMTVLDVGQGQCILLQSEGRTYMVDCGGMGAEATADEAAETLLAQGISHLDGIVVTHFDSDHCAAVPNLLTRVDADVIFLPDVEDQTGAAKAIDDASEGDIYPVNDVVELRYSNVVITIVPSYSDNSDNESGLCVLFQTENCAILITGDRDEFGERMLLRSIDLPELDALVVGHHGSKYSTGRALLEAARPEVAIISVGENNTYGHPAEETLERLNAYGCRVYRTDIHGTIIFRR